MTAKRAAPAASPSAGAAISAAPAVPAAAPLSPAERQRYQRHLVLPEIGAAGQQRLKAARVLLVGAGGLGSPAALYLAAAGVGTLGMVDFDRVDLSNLHRQVLHGDDRVGQSKLDSARRTLANLNPHVHFVAHETRLDATNARELIGAYDLVVDGADNFATRYLVNDACVLLGKPNVHGSVLRFEGQLSVFSYAGGPCYRCLYPEPPPPGQVPSCAEGGVLGVLPGVVGCLQATEAIKIITGQGRTLSGRLLLYDALAMSFRELQLARDPQCPVCGAHPRITKLVEYEGYCDMLFSRKRATKAAPAFAEITAPELHARLQRGDKLCVLDVREPSEYETGHLAGALHLPVGSVAERLGELDRNAEIVVYCRGGVRSARAAKLLAERGFPKIHNLTGGILAWAEQVDPKMPT